MNVAYGFDPKSKDDPYISEALEVVRAFEIILLPGAFLVDRIPLLKYVPAWMPGAGFKRFAEYYRNATYRAQRKPFYFATEAMVHLVILNGATNLTRRCIILENERSSAVCGDQNG